MAKLTNAPASRKQTANTAHSTTAARMAAASTSRLHVKTITDSIQLLTENRDTGNWRNLHAQATIADFLIV